MLQNCVYGVLKLRVCLLILARRGSKLGGKSYEFGDCSC